VRVRVGLHGRPHGMHMHMPHGTCGAFGGARRRWCVGSARAWAHRSSHIHVWRESRSLARRLWAVRSRRWRAGGWRACTWSWAERIR
jgi:hypothetical protein